MISATLTDFTNEAQLQELSGIVEVEKQSSRNGLFEWAARLCYISHMECTVFMTSGGLGHNHMYRYYAGTPTQRYTTHMLSQHIHYRPPS